MKILKTNMLCILFLAATLAGCQLSSNPAAAGSDHALSGSAQGETWNVPGDFATIQDAIDDPAVQSGDRILVGPGEHAGAVVTKGVEIQGTGGAIITSGPATGPGQAGFRFIADHSGDGATIEHLTFVDVEFAVYGDVADDVTVRHNSMANPIQGVTNWGGSGWTIEHNEVHDLRTSCGGGIGILVGDRAATAAGVRDNVIAHNTISGTLHVSPGDCGGYDGTGIVLYADFRSGSPGAIALADNLVDKNRVALVSDTPSVVDVIGVELTDTRDDETLPPVIFDNTVTFNDLRGTVRQIVLTPENLDDFNEISRNMGENRGRGQGSASF